MNRGGAAFPAHEPSPVAASRQSAAVRRNNQPAALCRDAATPAFMDMQNPGSHPWTS